MIVMLGFYARQLATVSTFLSFLSFLSFLFFRVDIFPKRANFIIWKLFFENWILP